MTERPILFSGEMVRAILEGRNGKRLPKKVGRPIPERLANGIDSAPVNGCWEWQRTKNTCGYGQLRVNGQMRYAHRLAYEYSKGPVPVGMSVCHTCDNPACINPDHLWVGNQSENARDAYAKGRAKQYRRGEYP